MGDPSDIGAHLPAGLTPGAIGIWVLVFTLLGTLVKVWPAIKKIQNEGDQSLRDSLMARIEKLEKRIDNITAHHAAERELSVAEIGVMRHRMNNESQSVDALLHLIESGADSIATEVPRITEQRAQAAKTFANEMNTITAARLRIAATAAKEA